MEAIGKSGYPEFWEFEFDNAVAHVLKAVTLVLKEADAPINVDGLLSKVAEEYKAAEVKEEVVDNGDGTWLSVDW